MLEPIPDLLDDNLKIVFVGFNPSIRSGETGHHYANPRNRFWNILHQSGLTDRVYDPREDRLLLTKFGYGFTNIVERPTKEAAEITKAEYKDGKVLLRKKLKRYQPQVVCFVGKGVYNQYSGRRKVEWGLQKEPVISGMKEFVAPSSSGLVRMKIIDIIRIYEKLHEIVV
ncbi:mismatch-specific DNA-glycosylase [Bacillus sp. Marseille-Q3570]|uniref:mismatch-specific DNA-glycosylase n=1 Tax=Bacillus sp. Marseille-Q3570 TaxID=2963522 RepID=UPI0021B7C16F|nr:mismatch-specific DNA-glycosylase [Bacillus sp. Marseille-Q3570]